MRSESIRKKQLKALAPIEEWSRLRCYGNRDELDALRDIESHFFEPYILQSSSFAQPGGTLQAAAPKNLFLLLAVIALFVVLSKLGFSNVWIFAFYCLMYLAAIFTTYHVLPVYYRITPGSLEVLRPKIASRDLQLRRKVDLTNVKITCYFGGELIIQVPNEQTEKILLPYFSFEDEREFIQKIFTAAISPHKSPNLPANALTG